MELEGSGTGRGDDLSSMQPGAIARLQGSGTANLTGLQEEEWELGIGKRCEREGNGLRLQKHQLFLHR